MSGLFVENFLATFLRLVLIHLFSTRSPSYPNKTRV